MGAYLRRDAEVRADLERMLELLPRLRERFSFWRGASRAANSSKSRSRADGASEGALDR